MLARFHCNFWKDLVYTSICLQVTDCIKPWQCRHGYHIILAEGRKNWESLLFNRNNIIGWHSFGSDVLFILYGVWSFYGNNDLILDVLPHDRQSVIKNSSLFMFAIFSFRYVNLVVFLLSCCFLLQEINKQVDRWQVDSILWRIFDGVLIVFS